MVWGPTADHGPLLYCCMSPLSPSCHPQALSSTFCTHVPHNHPIQKEAGTCRNPKEGGKPSAPAWKSRQPRSNWPFRGSSSASLSMGRQ